MVQWLERGTAADPGRVHTEGRIARLVVEEQRSAVAELLGTRPRQLVFTSGGTEAVHSAVWGSWRARPAAPMAMAEVEHSSVRDAVSRLTEVRVLPVDSSGRIAVDALSDVLEDGARHAMLPSLVHCQWANHEVGTLQPVREVVELCRAHGVGVHVDACAAAGHVPLSLDELDADLVSVSAHKFGGPAGIGALVLRRGLRLEPLMVGGEQERARRGGLENVAAIVGFGATATALLGDGGLAAEQERARRLTERLAQIALAVEGVHLLGDQRRRLPHILCLAVDGVEAEPVLLGLDQAGIAAHSGSSCASESLAPSPVLAAMGVDAERSLRLSVGWSSTEADVDAFAVAFGPVVEALRGLRYS